MRRFLLNPIAQDGAAIDVAMVWVGRDSARRWMRLMEIFIDTDRETGGKLGHLSLYDDEAGFFEGWPEDVEDLVDRLSDEGCVEIPDGVDADFSVPPDVLMDTNMMLVDGEGVRWRACTRYTGLLVDTPAIPWDTIKAIADEAEPRDNTGRGRCWWCGTGTVKVPLFTGVADECPDCRK